GVRERVAARALVDVLQLTPLLALIVLRHPEGVGWLPAVLATLSGTLLAVDALGALASSLASSAGEVMLWVMLPLLPSFYLSALFLPASGPMAVVERAFPFSWLHDSLTGALGGTPTVGAVPGLAAGLAWLAL